jgi:hypothetical protein
MGLYLNACVCVCVCVYIYIYLFVFGLYFEWIYFNNDIKRQRNAEENTEVTNQVREFDI